MVSLKVRKYVQIVAQRIRHFGRDALGDRPREVVRRLADHSLDGTLGEELGRHLKRAVDNVKRRFNVLFGKRIGGLGVVR